MDINWYPGHMTKSIRMIEESVKGVDVVIYVLDARAPKSCINPDFDKLLTGKPIIYALNKSDLADEKQTELWKQRLQSAGEAVVLNSAAGKITELFPLIKKLAGEKLRKYLNKGVKASVKVMVLGVPNTGKSTLVNNMCGRAKTVTGNKPGVTRGKQWVKVNEYTDVLDTPGTLYPKLADKAVAAHLAYLGSIRDEVTDSAELAASLIAELNVLYAGVINDRYGVDVSGGAFETLEKIALKKGCLKKGGTDTERAAMMVLDDFRKGRLGRITLDR